MFWRHFGDGISGFLQPDLPTQLRASEETAVEKREIATNINLIPEI
jgi:hypothetical protein